MALQPTEFDERKLVVLLNWCMQLQILIKKIVSTKSYFLGSKILILNGKNDKILAIFKCLIMFISTANFSQYLYLY